MTDNELLNCKDFSLLNREQLIRRGWLLQMQEAKNESEKEQCRFFMNEKWNKNIKGNPA